MPSPVGCIGAIVRQGRLVRVGGFDSSPTPRENEALSSAGCSRGAARRAELARDAEDGSIAMTRLQNSKKALLSGPPTQSATAHSNREDTTRGINLSLARDILGRVHRHLDPAGGCMTFVPHPARGDRKAVLVGIVFEHRFAFYYWIKCKQELRWDRHVRQRIPDRDFVPPDLVTMDWHDDIGGECDMIEAEIRRLNQSNEAEVGLFSWAGLRSINDGHVFPAERPSTLPRMLAYLNQAYLSRK
ncbi:hypothetical protein IMZ48_31125 [Candidatus Bathyarchaeota archaeon]|nr:hypothetical protein [Candidatus Bathyarchaeota archaeon]